MKRRGTEEKPLPPLLPKELPNGGKLVVSQLLVIPRTIRTKIRPFIACSPACGIEELVRKRDLRQVLPDVIVTAGNPLSRSSIPCRCVPLGRDSVTLKKIGVYEVQDAVEQNHDSPVIRGKRRGAELGRKGFVMASLVEVLLNSHAQETAASATREDWRGEKNTTSAKGDGGREVVRNSKLTSGKHFSTSMYS